MGCRWLVRWSSLGPVVLRDRRKLERFPSISIHTPLAFPIAFPSHLTRLWNTMCFNYFIFFPSIQRDSWVLWVSGVYCDGYQFALEAQVLQVHTKTQIQSSISPVKGSSHQAAQCNLILGAGSEALTVDSSALFQVFLHRLNQYAATKIDKNITEETVKVRADHCGVRRHNSFLQKREGHVTHILSAQRPRFHAVTWSMKRAENDVGS